MYDFFMFFLHFLSIYNVYIYMCIVVTLTLSLFVLQMWEKLDDLLLGWWDTIPFGGFQVEVPNPWLGGRVEV